VNSTYWTAFVEDHFYNVTYEHNQMVPVQEINMTPQCLPEIAPDYCYLPKW